MRALPCQDTIQKAREQERSALPFGNRGNKSVMPRAGPHSPLQSRTPISLSQNTFAFGRSNRRLQNSDAEAFHCRVQPRNMACDPQKFNSA